MAYALPWLTTLDVVQQLVVAAPGDDLHAKLALSMLGGVQVAGFSVFPN